MARIHAAFWYMVYAACAKKHFGNSSVDRFMVSFSLNFLCCTPYWPCSNRCKNVMNLIKCHFIFHEGKMMNWVCCLFYVASNLHRYGKMHRLNRFQLLLYIFITNEFCKISNGLWIINLIMYISNFTFPTVDKSNVTWIFIHGIYIYIYIYI